MHLNKVIMLTQPEVWETTTSNLYLVYGDSVVATVARHIDIFEHTEKLECTNIINMELANLYTGVIQDIKIDMTQTVNETIQREIVCELSKYFKDNPTE